MHGKPHKRASTTTCAANPGEHDHTGCGELTAPLLWPTGTGNCVPPLTNGLRSRRREQPGERDCVDHTIPGKCEPSVDEHSTKLPHPPQHCGPWVPRWNTRETPTLFSASWAPLNRGNPSHTTSKRRLSVSGTGASRSLKNKFVATRVPPSRQTRAAALSNANPRLPRTPALEHAAQ